MPTFHEMKEIIRKAKPEFAKEKIHVDMERDHIIFTKSPIDEIIYNLTYKNRWINNTKYLVLHQTEDGFNLKITTLRAAALESKGRQIDWHDKRDVGTVIVKDKHAVDILNIILFVFDNFCAYERKNSYYFPSVPNFHQFVDDFLRKEIDGLLIATDWLQDKGYHEYAKALMFSIENDLFPLRFSKIMLHYRKCNHIGIWRSMTISEIFNKFPKSNLYDVFTHNVDIFDFLGNLYEAIK